MSRESTESHRFDPSTQCRPRGVTLTELLTVTVAGALGLSLLLPGVRRAREQSLLDGCLDNLRGIAQAGLQYAAEDRNENAIPAHFLMCVPGAGLYDLLVSQYAWGGKSGIGPTSGTILGFMGTGHYCGPATRPLNRLIYKTKFPDYYLEPERWAEDTQLDLTLFQCPGDNGYPGGVIMPPILQTWLGVDHGVPAYDYFGTSYSAAQLWVSYIGGNPHDYLMSNSPFLRPLSRVADPARTFLYLETAGKDAYRYERLEDNDPCDPCFVPDRSCIRGQESLTFVARGWHGQRFFFNHAFADGHVEFLRVRGTYCQDIPEFSGSGCCGLDIGENGRDRRIIIRGPRWQLDTLPDPPIVTRVHNPHKGNQDQAGPDEDKAPIPAEVEF
ncbi:MAG: hypothetical protein JSU68_03240 [Phycisphaerales bacterium]|nr:MAG: hypothetical protein JSU68_03240 [Phycisphaerales bacterium]